MRLFISLHATSLRLRFIRRITVEFNSCCSCAFGYGTVHTLAHPNLSKWRQMFKWLFQHWLLLVPVVTVHWIIWYEKESREYGSKCQHCMCWKEGGRSYFRLLCSQFCCCLGPAKARFVHEDLVDVWPEMMAGGILFGHHIQTSGLSKHSEFQEELSSTFYSELGQTSRNK